MFKSIFKFVIRPQILLLILIVIAAIVLWKMGLLPIGVRASYQAVFLSNSQVYFGKLTSRSAQYATLTDIYYLQFAQPPQPQRDGQQQTPNVTLVKLGNELHGPIDKMEINRDHIVFIEDLRADSQVIAAIDAYKNSQQ